MHAVRGRHKAGMGKTRDARGGNADVVVVGGQTSTAWAPADRRAGFFFFSVCLRKRTPS